MIVENKKKESIYTEEKNPFRKRKISDIIFLEKYVI